MTNQSSTPFAMTVKQASEYSGIGQNRLRELCKNGDVKAIKVGTKYLIPTELLERYILEAAETGRSL